MALLGAFVPCGVVRQGKARLGGVRHLGACRGVAWYGLRTQRVASATALLGALMRIVGCSGDAKQAPRAGRGTPGGRAVRKAFGCDAGNALSAFARRTISQRFAQSDRDGLGRAGRFGRPRSKPFLWSIRWTAVGKRRAVGLTDRWSDDVVLAMGPKECGLVVTRGSGVVSEPQLPGISGLADTHNGCPHNAGQPICD